MKKPDTDDNACSCMTQRTCGGAHRLCGKGIITHELIVPGLGMKRDTVSFRTAKVFVKESR